MDYLFITLVNSTSEYVTLQSVTGFSDNNMFVGDQSITIPPNTTTPYAIVSGAYETATVIYNITEEMLLTISWKMDETPPTNFSAGVTGGTEYSVSWGASDPVVTVSSVNINYYDYTYNLTLSQST